MNYILTKENKEDLDHLESMLDLELVNISSLCNDEKSDIEYGFQLGQTFSHLSKLKVKLMIMLSELKTKT